MRLSNAQKHVGYVTASSPVRPRLSTPVLHHCMTQKLWGWSNRPEEYGVVALLLEMACILGHWELNRQILDSIPHNAHLQSLISLSPLHPGDPADCQRSESNIRMRCAPRRFGHGALTTHVGAMTRVLLLNKCKWPGAGLPV